jgi:hypothetical protein
MIPAPSLDIVFIRSPCFSKWQLSALFCKDSEIRFGILCLHLFQDSVFAALLAITGCGKLTSFFVYEMPYEKGS